MAMPAAQTTGSEVASQTSVLAEQARKEQLAAEQLRALVLVHLLRAGLVG